jgi:hypothetical protein
VKLCARWWCERGWCEIGDGVNEGVHDDGVNEGGVNDEGVNEGGVNTDGADHHVGDGTAALVREVAQKGKDRHSGEQPANGRTHR